MKNRSGVGCRVSGVGFEALLVCILLLCSGLSNPGFGQEMKYQFKKGQIFNYQYKTEYVDTSSGTKNDTRTLKSNVYLFEFKVDSLSDSGAYLTFTPKQYSQNIDVFRKYAEPLIFTKTYIEGDKDPAETAYYGDLNRVIRFHISETGQLSEFSGSDDILEDVASLFQPTTTMPTQGLINYNWLKMRYSEEYYRILIRQFLPPLPVMEGRTDIAKDNIELRYSQDKISFGMHFGESNPDPKSGRILFSNQIIITKVNQDLTKGKSEKNKTSITPLLTNPIGTAHWSMAGGIMDTLEFQGTDLPALMLSLVNENSLAGNDAAKEIELSDIKIELANRSAMDLIYITLNIHQADSMTMETVWPWRGEIEKRIMPNKIKKDLYEVSMATRLDHPGFIDIFFYRPSKTGPDGQNDPTSDLYSYRILNHNKIRMYTDCGDSISVNFTMGQLDNISFSGSHVAENVLLNKLFRFQRNTVGDALSENLPVDLILKSLKEDQRLVDQSRDGLDPKFLEQLDFELLYLAKQFELSELRNLGPNSIHRSLRDTLVYYKKFLGRLDHLDSFTYLGFVQQFFRASLYHAGIDVNSENQNEYRAAEIFLQGWDRYWMLAKLALEKLREFEDFDYAANYRSFIQEYPETPFGQFLSAEYRTTRYFDDQSQVAKLDLKPFIGNPVMVSIDYEKSKTFVETFIKEKLNVDQSKAKLVLYLRDKDKETLLFQLQRLTGSSENNLAVLSSKFSITVREMTEYLSAISQLRNPKILIFDRNGRFLSYFKDHYDEVKINNMLSWP